MRINSYHRFRLHKDVGFGSHKIFGRILYCAMSFKIEADKKQSTQHFTQI